LTAVPEKLMPLDPKTLIHRWFDEVWNHGREDTVDELFALDGIVLARETPKCVARRGSGFSCETCEALCPTFRSESRTPSFRLTKPSFESSSKERILGRVSGSLQRDAE
jgi:hypothetical protein